MYVDSVYDHYRCLCCPVFDPELVEQVWKAAAEQIFFSLSACYGGLITLASYNKFHTNVFRDTMIIAFGNCMTSFFAGFVIFSFLGALALQLGVKVSEVTTSGEAPEEYLSITCQ